MKIFLAMLILLAGCAGQKQAETVDAPDETIVMEDTAIEPERKEKKCSSGYVPVCNKRYIGESSCRCVPRSIPDGVMIPR